MRSPDSPAADHGFEPRRPTLVAACVYIAASFSLFWPLLKGGFFSPSGDQYMAGYSFRLFGAEMFKSTGSIPLWNPYIFGGMPYVAGMHGDIFYPTAWLRWIMPVGTAMGLGFAIHLVLAGVFAFLLLRALKVSWTAALVGGLAYEMTGILASMVSPGHDGKLFVSALAPLLLFALLRGIRDGRLWGFALAALTVGLCLLSPHPQMSYYAFLAAGLWSVYLTFWAPGGPGGRGWPRHLGLALAAVLLGVAIAAIQVLPFLHYLPASARAAALSPEAAWEYATGYAYPPSELLVTLLPQFNGVLGNYWGNNFVKSHTEYLGALVVILAVIGVVSRERRRLVWALGGIAALFLLIAFGGHTPFYRLWYEVMPGMKKVRAPGMAFFLVALPVCVFAALGVDRLLRREVRPIRVLIAAGLLALLGVLGVTGILQSVALGMADPRLVQVAAANGPALAAGSLRLLLMALVGGGVFWAVAAGRLRGVLAAMALVVVISADLWSVDRLFFNFGPPAEQLFADDAITTRLHQDPPPFRVWDAAPQNDAGWPSVYPGSFLMAKRVQVTFGYHGNEIQWYDQVWGGKNQYRNMTNAALWDVWAVKYVVVRAGLADSVPGFHRVLGPVVTAYGDSAILFQRDSLQPYARVVPAAVKIPEDQIVTTVNDVRFPVGRVVLYPESTSVTPPPLRGALPAPSAAVARVDRWSPGHMTISIDHPDPSATYLLVAESWYSDWRATVDGRRVPTHRGDYAMISVPLPPGAKGVALDFISSSYETGRLVTLLALLATAALFAVSLLPRHRRTPGDPPMARA